MAKKYTRRNFINTLGTAAADVPIMNTFGKENSEPAMENILDDIKKKGAGKRPNIIFILSDDHRFDFMSFMGKPSFIKTPAMDKMAKKGFNFRILLLLRHFVLRAELLF